MNAYDLDDAFVADRSRLLGVAYRMTGSWADAEDIVQDTWLRWQATDRERIERPAAWLTMVASRLALDRLKSAQHRRESYVGPWLPEPIETDPGPEERTEMAESLTIGFLAMLERLGPVERVVFLLADVFATPFDEIAEVVERSPAACRQVASRARRRVHEERPRYAATDEAAWEVAAAFLTASQEGDLDALLALLAPDAVAVSDGGADHHAARRPVIGDRIPRFFINLARRTPPGAEVVPCLLNGQPAVIVEEQGRPTIAMTLSVVDGRVTRIDTVVNPEKLRGLQHA